MSDASSSDASSSEAKQAVAPPVKHSSRLSIQEKVGYGLGDTASNLYWKTFEFFLLIFYTDVYGLSAKSVATLFLVTRLWDAFNDPIVGYMADRTRTRWGRFRPYLVWMSVPLAVTAAFTFYTPDFSDNGKLLYAYITYTLVMMAYTAINTPYGALMGVISPKSNERTSVSTYRFVCAFTGAIFIQYFTLDLVDYFGAFERVAGDGTMETAVDQQHGFFCTVSLYGVMSVCLFFITFANTRERVMPSVERMTTTSADFRFLLCSRRLHQIVLVSVSLALGLTMELKPQHLISMGAVYLIASGLSWLVSKSIQKHMDPIGVNSSFQQDFHDLLRNGPWMVLFAYGLLLLISGFVRNGAIVYYFKYYAAQPDKVSLFLVSGSLSAIAGMLIANPLAARFGKAKVLMTCNLCAALGTAMLFFVDSTNTIGMFAIHAAASFLMGPVAVLLWAMYADAADYSEWKTHRRATGLVFSAATFSQKLGCSIGAATAAGLLAGFGYASPVDGIEQTQSEATLLGIRLMMSCIPAIFLMLAAAALWFYPIDSQMLARIECELADRRQALPEVA